MKKVIIEAVYAVGMHHFGERSLNIGRKYVSKAEPTNSNDKHAVAIYKAEQKVGYLKRDHARHISRLYKMNVVKTDPGILLKPKFEPVIRNRRVGPEQRCNVGFFCDESNVACASEVLKVVTIFR